MKTEQDGPSPLLRHGRITLFLLLILAFFGAWYYFLLS